MSGNHHKNLFIESVQEMWSVLKRYPFPVPYILAFVLILISLAGPILFFRGISAGDLLLSMGGFGSSFFILLILLLTVIKKDEARIMQRGDYYPKQKWAWRYVLALFSVLPLIQTLLMVSFGPDRAEASPSLLPIMLPVVLLFWMPLILHLARSGRRGPKIIWWQAVLFGLGFEFIFGAMMESRNPSNHHVWRLIAALVMIALGIALAMPFWRHQTMEQKEL